MLAVHHQGSRPVHVGGIQGLGRNSNGNYRSGFSLRDRFLETYSSQRGSAAGQCVDAEFLGLHPGHGGPANLRLRASQATEDGRTP